MNRKANIEEVLREIEKRKISHERTGKLITNLTQKVLSITEGKSEVRERVFTLEQSRYLIGEQVGIENPNKHKKNVGIILAVGKVFITVDLGNGLRRNRIAKNLCLIES